MPEVTWGVGDPPVPHIWDHAASWIYLLHLPRAEQNLRGVE